VPRDFVAVRATVVGFVVRAVTDWVAVRDAAVVRGATLFVVVRCATFFVAARGSVAGIALRAFAGDVRPVDVVFDFID